MLPRKNRIATALFPAVTRGKTMTGSVLRITIKKDETLSFPKCAVIVSQKIAKTAVERNLLRRRCYDSLGRIISRLPHAYICIFPQKKEITSQEIDHDLNLFLK